MPPFDLAASLAAASRQNARGCVKIEEDLVRYERVIEASRPDGIIEVGTFSGKSALFFAETAGAPVFTIDVHAQVDPATQERWFANRVTGHVGSSLTPHTAWAVREWMRRSQVGRPMVVLDGDHSGDTVLDEMHLYGRLVTPGGYMVVEDTLVRWMPHEQVEYGGPYRGSPMDAVEKFMADAGTAWELDADTDSLFSVGQYPSGWLRRTG